MPAIFNEEQREKIRINLLEKGFDLLKRYGYKRLNLGELASACGIAKGTFYGFFKSKEQFIYEVMLYERSVIKQAVVNFQNSSGTLSQYAFRQYILYMLHDNRNIFSYLTKEEQAILTCSWPKDYLLNLNNDEKTANWILDMIPDKSPSCDWRIFANYMKSIGIIANNQDLLICEVYEETLNLLIQNMIDYIWTTVFQK